MALYLLDTSNKLTSGGVLLYKEGIKVIISGDPIVKATSYLAGDLTVSIAIADLRFFPAIVFLRKPYVPLKES